MRRKRYADSCIVRLLRDSAEAGQGSPGGLFSGGNFLSDQPEQRWKDCRYHRLSGDGYFGEKAEAPAEEAPAENAAPEAGNRRGEGRRARPRPSVRGEGEGRRRQRPQAPAVPAPVENTEDVLDEVEESLPFTPVEELDPQRLEALTKEAVRQLVRPIVGEEVTLEVTVADGRVRVAVDCEEDSGLLIGREGQTLASLQYLASRVVSRGMNAAVRVQLDAGRYRQRQDEKLREMALALAEKVRQTGRSYSTRPLSSYHRRIVHLCLQDAEEVQTRSSGDGPMKRVVIMRRRPERS